MEHMYIDSGTTNIFDDVDKSDFKTDFGSEFPVGLTSGFCFSRRISSLFYIYQHDLTLKTHSN